MFALKHEVQFPLNCTHSPNLRIIFCVQCTKGIATKCNPFPRKISPLLQVTSTKICLPVKAPKTQHGLIIINIMIKVVAPLNE